MTIIVLGLVCFIVFFSFRIIEATEYNYFAKSCVQQKREKQEYQPDIEPFSPSKYLERIESEHIKILQEQEKKEPHTIILWLNLEGLKLNKDGSFEWIDRVKKKQPEKTPVYPQDKMFALAQMANQYKSPFDYMTAQCQNIASQIDMSMMQCTQSQLNSLWLAQAQQAQNAALVNAINVNVPPAYGVYGIWYKQAQTIGKWLQ